MTNPEDITNEIFKDLNFTKEECKVIANSLHPINLKKGDFLLESEAPVLHQYYVRSGCLRTYFLDTNGKEHTLQFAINDWWISDYTAFFTSGKAIMYIDTIEDAQLYRISKRDLDSLFKDIPKLEPFFRKKMEKAFASFQKRILGSLSQSAEERYLQFKKRYPSIEQSVKNYHIASYLGITTESLSRIRKKLLLH